MNRCTRRAIMERNYFTDVGQAILRLTLNDVAVSGNLCHQRRARFDFGIAASIFFNRSTTREVKLK